MTTGNFGECAAGFGPITTQHSFGPAHAALAAHHAAAVIAAELAIQLIRLGATYDEESASWEENVSGSLMLLERE